MASRDVRATREMDLVRAFHSLRRRWALVVAPVLLAGIAAGIVTLRETPCYQSSITLFVSGAEPTMTSTSAYQASLLSQERVKSYAGLLESGRLARDLAARIGEGLSADRLRSEISAEPLPGTVLLRATVTDHFPGRARRIADVLGTEFIRFVADLERPAGDSTAPIKVSVVDDARQPTAPVSPRPVPNLVLGLLIGLAIGVGAVLLLDAVATAVPSDLLSGEGPAGPAVDGGVREPSSNGAAPEPHSA